jgi:(p)ppGpp synthase/HD superfamily hydrolase
MTILTDAEHEAFQKKQLAALRQWLDGAARHDERYYAVLRALELARLIHVHLRKDGRTWEATHQYEMCLHATTLPNIRDLPRLLIVILCHDMVEDYALPFEVITRLFDGIVREAVDCMTKVIPVFGETRQIDIGHLTPDNTPLTITIGIPGTEVAKNKRDENELFARMALNLLASLAKAIDRANNQRSMGGVFSRDKQVSYVTFTRQMILPMLKLARVNFPDQKPAYENLKHFLVTQERLVLSWAAMPIAA